MKQLIYFFLFLSNVVYAQDVNIFQHFLQQETLKCTLTTDIKFLTAKKHIEEYVPSVLNVNGEDYKVEIKTRGNSRKTICYFPPFKIKFDKEQLKIKEPNSFKLVNCCKNNVVAEQLLLKEYFTYKLYNIITPRSLQALLLDMTYQDSNKKKKGHAKFALMLEEEESFSERFGGVIYEPKVTFSNRLDTLQLAIMTMFEYMIGNTDWAMGNQHNCFVVRHKKGLPFPVAYDFDYSGFVNADYAVPQANTPIKSVRQRHNRGRCMTEENCTLAAELFLSKKEEILKFTQEFPHFQKNTTKSTYKYLESFFDDLENEKSAHRIFCKDCKPMIK